MGLELALNERWTALPEVYGDRHGAAQAGLRRSLGEHASLDVLVGQQHGLQHGPWITLGLNVLLPN